MLYLIYLSCLFLSFLIGFINRKALQRRQLSLLVPYLLLVFVQELTIYIIRETYAKPDVVVVYNIYRPITVCMFAWVFYYLPLKRFYRKAIPWITIIYLVTTFSIFLFKSSIWTYNIQLSFAGGIALTLFGILSFFDYFNLDSATEEEKWRPVLWITAGIVIFYPIVNISFAFYKDIFAMNATIFGVYLYNAIPQILSIIMYSCFAFAFYLCRKNYSLA
jgi:hypothetical protein